MSIMPNQSPQSRMPRAACTVVFWALMIALGAVLWQINSNPATRHWPQLIVVLVAAVAYFAIFALTSTVWSFVAGRRWKMRQRGSESGDPANRPLG